MRPRMITNRSKVEIIRPLFLSGIVCLALLMSGGVFAGPLADLYQLALENDPQLKRAEAEFMAGQEAPIQGRAGLLPRAEFSADTTRKAQSLNNGLTAYTVRLSQPVFNANSFFNFKRSTLIAENAVLNFEKAEQEVIIRSVEAYLQVLKSMSGLENAKAQERALLRRLDQVNAQFDVGIIAITDVQEARAVYDLATVNRIDAQSNLVNSYEALESLAGQTFSEISLLSQSFPIVPVEPNSPNLWTEKALEGNLDFRSAKIESEISRRNTQGVAANRLPEISLGIAHENRRTHGGIDNSWDENNTIQLSMSVPLFSGGGLRSQQRQAEHEQVANIQLAEHARRKVIENTRSLLRTLHISAQGIQARKQNILSSETALRATEEGFNFGTRNIVDVLQAEQSLFEANQDYENARIEYINSLFRFKQVIGTLSPDDLFALDRWLVD